MTLDGWLLLDKPMGMSSAQAVGRVKRLLKPSKIGHAGTLDPLASGVLPLALGQATKVCDFMLGSEKAYVFTVVWGVQRATDDAEGSIIATSSFKPTQEDILKMMPLFKGQQHQQPPLYSAIKVKGKRACDRVRAGEQVILSPRLIEIYDLELKEFFADKACFYVKCSKGTYVRSLARDMAKALGTYGYVSALTRVQSGKFYIKDTMTLEELAKDHEKGLLKEYMRPIQSVLDDIPAVVIRGDALQRFCQGQKITCDPTPIGLLSVFDESGLLIGLARGEKGTLCPKRLMVYNLKH